MWNIFIADDEPKIRRGLKQLVESFDPDFVVSGEAVDGLAALESVRTELPDIMLVDICMPRLNGLEFIEKIKEQSANSIIIVITGYDEFEYAKKAVELHVFAYILKPVDSKQLAETMQKAARELQARRGKNKLLRWAEDELSRRKSILYQEFFEDWILGNLSLESFKERKRFLSMDFSGEVSLLGLQVQERFLGGTISAFRENKVSRIAVEKLMADAMQQYSPWIEFKDQHDTAFYVTGKKLTEDFCTAMKMEIKEKLNLNTHCELIYCSFDFSEFINGYEKICSRLEQHNHTQPFIRRLSVFLETNFANKNMNLDQAAQYMAMSPGYVTRLLKQHTGYCFTGFTNRFRICKAMNLLVHAEKKVFEIADEVGYSGQHYFCRAFKRITGTSPSDFRREPEEQE